MASTKVVPAATPAMLRSKAVIAMNNMAVDLLLQGNNHCHQQDFRKLLSLPQGAVHILSDALRVLASSHCRATTAMVAAALGSNGNVAIEESLHKASKWHAESFVPSKSSTASSPSSPSLFLLPHVQELQQSNPAYDFENQKKSFLHFFSSVTVVRICDLNTTKADSLAFQMATLLHNLGVAHWRYYQIVTTDNMGDEVSFSQCFQNASRHYKLALRFLDLSLRTLESEARAFSLNPNSNRRDRNGSSSSSSSSELLYHRQGLLIRMASLATLIQATAAVQASDSVMELRNHYQALEDQLGSWNAFLSMFLPEPRVAPAA